MTSEIKQFKLTNDDEIICEVLEWDNDDTSNIIVRRALKIINVEDYSKGVRFFAFRPWMLFNDDPDELQTINSVHIIGELNPADSVVEKYMTSVVSLANAKHKSFPLDDVAKKAEEMDEDAFDEYMYKLSEEQELGVEREYDNDSDRPENIIKFKPRMH